MAERVGQFHTTTRTDTTDETRVLMAFFFDAHAGWSWMLLFVLACFGCLLAQSYARWLLSSPIPLSRSLPSQQCSDLTQAPPQAHSRRRLLPNTSHSHHHTTVISQNIIRRNTTPSSSSLSSYHHHQHHPHNDVTHLGSSSPPSPFSSSSLLSMASAWLSVASTCHSGVRGSTVESA